MGEKVIILGAGSHAKAIANIVRLREDNVIGFLDDNIKEGTEIIDNIEVIGKIEDCTKFQTDRVLFIIGIGNNEAREKIGTQYNLDYYTAIHPNAIIGDNVKIGKGTAVMANVVINTNTIIGNHCIVNTGAIIEHDNIIDDYVHVSPNATLCGTVSIGEKTHIGAGAMLRNNINICSDCIIGMGAVVVNDIKEKGIYIGVPAKKKKKKKVLFVASVAYHINKFHIPYLQYFKEQGYEVHVAARGKEKILYCDKHFDLDFVRNPFKMQNVQAYKQLKNIINENKYEIIHCHTPIASVLTRLAARKSSKQKHTKVIYTAHGFHFYKGAPLINWLIYYPIEKLMARYTDCLITLNREDYTIAKNKFKTDIKYINGVGCKTDRLNVNLTEEEIKKFKKDLHISEDSIVLSYIAELNKNKNQMLLIDMVKQLVKKNVNVQLLLIGEGKLKDFYQKQIKYSNLEDNIKLLGNRQDIGQLLSITDIYVASSIREGLPVNIMEAMYMGLPVVATNNRGHKELVIDNKNGYLIDIKDKRGFYNKILELSKNKDKRKEFGIISKNLSCNYLIDAVKPKFVKIYENIMK